MADKATYSALQKKAVSLPPYSVTTIDYIDTQPNYFRVQNSGETTLYCSTVNIPTQSQHDFSVKAVGMKMFAEPFNRSKLYIFNPSGDTVNISVLSFRAEFDPLTLALTDIGIDLEGASIESSNVISGFNVPLPAGGNEIGKVQVTSIPALPTGGNHIGSVDVDNLKDYTTQLTNILAAIGNIQISGGEGEAAEETALIFSAVEGTANNAGRNILSLAGASMVKKIHYLSNDGEADITVSLKSVNGRLVSMTVKAGEVINDISGDFDTFMIAGNDIPYRVAVSVIPAE